MKNFWKIVLALALALCVTCAFVACGEDDIKDTEGDTLDGQVEDTDDTVGDTNGDTDDTESDTDGTESDTDDIESDTQDTESDTDAQGGMNFDSVDTSTGFGPLTPAN